MNEMNRLRAIMLGLSTPGVRLFRNNCGALKDADGRLIRYGVANPGGSDLIGWKSVTVTPEMVGQKLAVFLAIEVKGERTRVTDQQRNFIERVRLDGGLAGVARSVEDALAITSPTINQ
jgi:hypothetical protein